MKRNTDYTSDAVKESVRDTMAKVEAYFAKHWREGKEYEVTKHIKDLLNAEIDKYVALGPAGNVYLKLDSLARNQKAYEECYAKNQEKYGPYVMELFGEYAHCLSLTGRYDVGDRYPKVSSEILMKMSENLFTPESLAPVLEKLEAEIDKFMKKHGVGYSLKMGSIAYSIDVKGDITLVKQDAPRGTLRYEFGKVSGSFICKDCGLKNLFDGPKEVGGDFDCSNNKLTKMDLLSAPKVVGGDFIWTGNAEQVTRTEIKKHVKVGGRIITDAPLTPQEEAELRKQVIKEQKEFQKKYYAMADKAEIAIKNGDVKTLEECREFFYEAIDFFKERPWLTAMGMKMSYQVLTKLFLHLHDFAPEKYPDPLAENVKLRRLTERSKYDDGDWGF